MWRKMYRRYKSISRYRSNRMTNEDKGGIEMTDNKKESTLNVIEFLKNAPKENRRLLLALGMMGAEMMAQEKGTKLKPISPEWFEAMMDIVEE